MSAYHSEPPAVVVTGGAGRAGRRVVAALVDMGHNVKSVDVVPWVEAPCSHLLADLRSLSECVEVIEGCEAIIHLAGTFAPGVQTPAATFHTNTTSTFNVFRAAALASVRRVVWASTCAVMGAPFGEDVQPDRVPVREDDATICSTTYALSKRVGEAIADESRIWGSVSFAALRFSWIFHPGGYEGIQQFWDDPHARKFNLWAYVDVRDVVQACTRALTAPIEGSESFFITAGDTMMTTDSRDLASEVFPDTTLDSRLSGNATLFSIEKAGQILGYVPEHSWRDELRLEQTP